MTNPKVIGVVLFVITISVFWIIAYRSRRNFWQAIIGENDKLDLPEIVVIIWVVVFPVIALADPLLGLEASEKVWWGMDLILLFALTGKVSIEYLKK